MQYVRPANSAEKRLPPIAIGGRQQPVARPSPSRHRRRDCPPFQKPNPEERILLRYGSVCSGIEAATVAWHPLGWKPAFFSEIAPFPSAVLAHHYPTVRNFGDFTTITPDQHDAIDLLVGGTPCQSFSIAGLRGGLADARGGRRPH